MWKKTFWRYDMKRNEVDKSLTWNLSDLLKQKKITKALKEIVEKQMNL